MNAPIIIFTYNRIQNLKKLISSLSKNPECKSSKAYIFLDGPKTQKDKIKSDEIFMYLKNIKVFCSLKIFYRKKNLGSAKNILDGINYVSNQETKFVVLEEDLIVSNDFLYFCNKMLNLYKNKKNIWHINCWVFDNLKSNDKFFFSTHMSCWGWATWSDRWKKFKKIKKQHIHCNISKKFRKKFDFLNTGSFIGLILNHKKKINTWAVYWYYKIFISKGITITPYKTLVINTGFKFNSENTKINYYKNHKILKNTIQYSLRFKEPFLDKKILDNINSIYLKKNFLLKNLNILREFYYRFF